MAEPATTRPRRRGWSLRSRLLFLSAVVPLPLVALLAWGLLRERDEALMAARESVTAHARQISAHHSRLIVRAQGLAAMLASLPVVRHPDPEIAAQVFASAVHRFRDYPRVRLCDPQGRVLASSPGDAAESPGGEEFFQHVIGARAPALGEPFVTPAGTWRVDFGAPITAHDGAITGVIAVTIDLESIRTFAAEGGLPRASVTVIGQTGAVMARAPAARTAERQVVDPALMQVLWAGRRSGYVESDRLDGVPSLVAYEALTLSPNSPPVIVAVSLPRQTVVGPVDRRIAQYGLSTFLVVALVIGAGLRGSGTLIARPVRSLVDVMGSFAAGDYSARVPADLRHDASEFGLLARTLTQLGEHLDQRDRERAEAHARLSATLSGYPGLAALFSPDHRIEEISATSVWQIGRPADAFIGHRLDALAWVAPAVVTQVGRLIDQALAGAVVQEEMVVVSPSSGPRLLDVHFSPVRNAAGAVEHVAAFGVDVTEAREAKRALMASRRELSEIFEGAPIALAYVTARSDGAFTLTSVNPAFVRLFDLPPLPPNGACLAQITPEHLRAAVIARCREAVRSRAVVTWEEEIDQASGPRFVQVSLSPLLDDTGECTRLIGSVHDYTGRRRAEDAVREYAARMALIFNTSSDLQILCRADDALTIEAVNRAFFDRIRTAAGDAPDPVGMSRERYLTALGFTPAQIAMHRDVFRAVAAHGSTMSYSVELPIPVTPDATPVRLDVTVTAHRGEQGECTHILWSGRDVTERWRAEQSLRASQQRLLEAQRMAQIGSWEVDLVTARRQWSAEVFRILELPADCVPTRELFLSIVHPDDRDRIEGVFAAAVATRRPYLVTHRLVMPDGRVKFVEQQAEIVLAASQTPVQARGTTQDITERVRVAEALRASEASLRRAEVLAGLGHFQCDADGGRLECSEGLTRLFACDAAAMPTLAHLTSRIHEGDRAEHERRFAEARDAGRPFDGTFRVPQGEGPARTLRARGEFLPDAASGGVRFFCTAVDISELKAAEHRLAELNDTLELRVATRTRDLKSSNQELEAFSYAVSHDLRAPLRAIEGFAHAVMESDEARLSPEGQAALARVRAAARRMGTLIDALLQLAHTFREPMVNIDVDLTALVRNLLDDIEQAHPSCRPLVTVADGLRTTGDPRQLRVAFMNLLDNAFKFSARAKAPAIEVGSRRIAGRDVLFVRDNGVGFDIAYVNKLFRPFERLHSPADFPGTGIGLATVQRVARRHGGSVWAESVPGQGATFYLVLDVGAYDERAADL